MDADSMGVPNVFLLPGHSVARGLAAAMAAALFFAAR